MFPNKRMFANVREYSRTCSFAKRAEGLKVRSVFANKRMFANIREYSFVFVFTNDSLANRRAW